MEESERLSSLTQADEEEWLLPWLGLSAVGALPSSCDKTVKPFMRAMAALQVTSCADSRAKH